MRTILLTVLLGLSSIAYAAEGLVTVASKHDVKTTTDKLE
jgi:hypothetical protein